MSNHPDRLADWTAAAVQRAIDASGLTKVAVSEATGIPYATLNRKLAAKTDFGFRDLLALAGAAAVRSRPSAPRRLHRWVSVAEI